MIRKMAKLVMLTIYYNYLLNAWYWIQITFQKARKIERKCCRKIFTLSCKFFYRHPSLYALADKISFTNSDEWRKVAGELVKSEGKILELGCGRFPAIPHGSLLDSSLPLLKQASDKFVRICSSANTLPFRDKTFNCALSIFPPGIAADEGFFQEINFWKEIRRVLEDNGKFVSLIYIIHSSRLSYLSRILDPLWQDFWENLRKISEGFKISRKDLIDSQGSTMIFVIAEKEVASAP